MPALIRIVRVSLVTIGAVVLWGSSVACETDSWSEHRVENAPSPAAPTVEAPSSTQLPNVSVDNQTEGDLAHEMTLHRAMYARYLKVLATYYSDHGYENKASWARIELQDMHKIRPSGLPPVVIESKNGRKQVRGAIEEPPGIDLPRIVVADRNEVDIIEEMLLHRSMYQRYLRVLGTYYGEHGQEANANIIRAELSDLQRVKTYTYITETESPSAPMKPLESIAEADRMYDQAQELLSKGGHHVLFFYNHATMNEALAKFKELVDKYPTSDKIDDAAYFIAEIHKEYNQERDNEIAIEWYKKAIAWNPDLNYPAWSHTAHIYDFRMHEREKALEWYQKVLEKEKGKTGWRFSKNIDVANKRIRELTVEETRHSPADLAGEDDRRSVPKTPSPVAPPVRTGAESSPRAPKAP